MVVVSTISIVPSLEPPSELTITDLASGKILGQARLHGPYHVSYGPGIVIARYADHDVRMSYFFYPSAEPLPSMQRFSSPSPAFVAGPRLGPDRHPSLLLSPVLFFHHGPELVEDARYCRRRPVPALDQRRPDGVVQDDIGRLFYRRRKGLDRQLLLVAVELKGVDRGVVLVLSSPSPGRSSRRWR